MINKKTVFVLGAGASCPYGYPSGACLRELICFDGGFYKDYLNYYNRNKLDTNKAEINRFIKSFKDSNIKSIDVFMANNPTIAPTGKYIIAYEIFRAERNSRFGEEAKREQERLEDLQKTSNHKSYLWGTAGFQGGDWYFYLYNRILEGLIGNDALPDFSNDNITFITFNYDRSLEQFLYNSLQCLYSEVPEDKIIQILKKLKIIHVYGQIAPLKWQNQNDYVDYKQQIDEPLLECTAKNIETIYEVKENPELQEAQKLLSQAEQILFLGFGYAPENMEILKLPDRTHKATSIYGTALGLESKEKYDIRRRIKKWLPVEHLDQIEIGYLKSSDNMDCLKLLRNYL